MQQPPQSPENLSSTASNLARATTLIMLVSVFGKLAGFVREQVIASIFGATGLTDAYVTAWTIAQMFVGLIAGAVGAAFLPALVRYLVNDDRGAGERLSSVVFRITSAVLLLAALGVAVGAPYITRLVVPNFTRDQQALTINMLRVLSPTIVLMGVGGLLVSYLNANKEFGWPAAVPLILSITTIAILYALRGRLGIYGLVWATLFGTVVQLLPLLWRVSQRGLGWLAQGNWGHPGLPQVARMVWPILIGSLFGQLYLLIEKGLASGLDAGSIAALSYANKLVQLPVGIFVTALTTAIFPTLSEYAGRNDMTGLSRSVASGTRLLLMVMVPAAVGLIVLRVPIVTLAFQRGSFDQAATAKTATALAYYALGLAAVSIREVLARTFYSMHDSRTPLAVGIGTALLNMALAVVLVKPLGHGGLALASSMAALASVICMLFLLRSKIGTSLDILIPLVKIMIGSGIMGGIVWVLHPMLQTFGAIASLGGSTLIGVIAYVVVIVLARVEEVNEFLAIIGQRARKAA